jgi:hypothetical protein
MTWVGATLRAGSGAVSVTVAVAVSVAVTVTAPRHVTDDSQDGCRYTAQNGSCVATGFQPGGRQHPGWRQRHQPAKKSAMAICGNSVRCAMGSAPLR